MLGHCGCSGATGGTGSIGLFGTAIALISELSANQTTPLLLAPIFRLISVLFTFPTIAPYHVGLPPSLLVSSHSLVENLEPFAFFSLSLLE